MTQIALLNPFRGLEVSAGESFTHDNFPVETTILVLSSGNRIWKKVLDRDGNHLEDERGPRWYTSPQVGVRMRVVNTSATDPVDAHSNVPVVWSEGSALVLDHNCTYTFLDEGVVGCGRMQDLYE